MTRSRSQRPARDLPAGQRRYGAHMSIAGGLHLAFERGIEAGCDVLQVFVKNQRQWQAPPLTDADVQAWRGAWAGSGISAVVAHATYLINLAAPDDTNWAKSIGALLDELRRCELLGIAGLVVHPGSHLGEGEAAGIRRIVRALDAIHEQAPGFTAQILLEVTAGQGSCLGHRFEHLGEIISLVREPQRLGVCFDTCHALAAGHDLTTPEGYETTIRSLARHIGLERVRCFHMNDSCKPLGSRVDRHAAIGKGCLGRAAFARLVCDRRFLGRPMILETPKGQDPRGRDLDRVNLGVLRQLARAAQPSKPARQVLPRRRVSNA